MVFFNRKFSDRYKRRRMEDSLDELFAWQWLILDELATVREELRKHMATSKEARDAVFALGGKIDALIAKGGVPAEMQADIDAIEADAKAHAEKLDAAVEEPVPPGDPVPEPEPFPDPEPDPEPSVF